MRWVRRCTWATVFITSISSQAQHDIIPVEGCWQAGKESRRRAACPACHYLLSALNLGNARYPLELAAALSAQRQKKKKSKDERLIVSQHLINQVSPDSESKWAKGL